MPGRDLTGRRCPAFVLVARGRAPAPVRHGSGARKTRRTCGRGHRIKVTVICASRAVTCSTAVLATLLLLPGAAAATCAESGPAAPRQDLALEVVSLVNAHRASIGVRQLAVSPSLMRSALWKSNHMVALGYFEHDDPAPPVARTVSQRAQACGYLTAFVGENIAYGYTEPAQVMQQWLDSPGHRQNIENPQYTQIGVGAAGPQRHWTQNFGSGGEGEPALAPPVGAADVITTPEDTSITAPVTANDSGQWIHSIGKLSHPSLAATPTGDGRGLSVRPARDFAGTATLVQRLADVAGQQTRAALVVRVTPVNDLPRARADSARLRRDARQVLVRVLANDSDVDGDRLSVQISRRPRHGAARVSAGRIAYRPKRRWPGRDSFAYRIKDAGGATAVATVGVSGPRRR